MSIGAITLWKSAILEKAVVEYLYHTMVIGRPHAEAQDVVQFRYKGKTLPSLQRLARRYRASGRPHIESIKIRRSRSPNAV